MEALLQSFAKDLNDLYPGYEFSNWPRSQLLTWFNDGLKVIAGVRPEKFTGRVVVEVDPCTGYADLTCCSNVRAVLGQSTESGRVIRHLQRQSKSVVKWSGRRRTTSSSSSELITYTLDEQTGLLSVSPIPPANIQTYLLVECGGVAPEFSADDKLSGVPDEFIPALRSFVLYNAKMMDAELSPSAKTSAGMHLEVFNSFMSGFRTSYDRFTDEDDRLEDTN